MDCRELAAIMGSHTPWVPLLHGVVQGASSFSILLLIDFVWAQTLPKRWTTQKPEEADSPVSSPVESPPSPPLFPHLPPPRTGRENPYFCASRGGPVQ